MRKGRKDKPVKLARRAARRVKFYNGVINGAVMPKTKRRVR
jgi:hypothetical protein